MSTHQLNASDRCLPGFLLSDRLCYKSTPLHLSKDLVCEDRTLLMPMAMTVKLIKRVFSRWYGVSILVTLDMHKQECYAQLNHDYTSTQVVQ